ncbi:MAG: protein phosphatase 2C domain-containing protein [Oscillospiraceae bacterium]|nr:protein phosphatase 2C domain-containing protein [Oscillospiraceae bacterium]
MELHVASYSDAGGREQNEDSILTAEQDSCGLFVAADGVGGYAEGAVASQTAVQMFADAFREKGAQTDLQDVLLAVNSRLRQEASGRRRLTTAAAVLVTPERITLAHVGDSRIYAFRDGELIQRSLDHSVAQMAVFRGEITPDGIRTHEDRCVLTQALGGYETIRPELSELSAGEADALLLCTDGFWEYVLEADMTRTLTETQTPEAWLAAMRALLSERVPVYNDNNSAVAVRITKQEDLT